MRECRKTHHLSNAQRAKGYGFQGIDSSEFLHPVEEFSGTIKRGLIMRRGSTPHPEFFESIKRAHLCTERRGESGSSEKAASGLN